jgi:hypothetical protein
MKPQRPSPEIRHTPANANLQHTSTTYKRTLTDIHLTHSHAGKTAICIKYGKCLYLQGVPEHNL